MCLLHISQIKKALGISGVLCNECSWRAPYSGDFKGAQIDLLIERADRAINLCEMKYTSGTYTIDKSYSETLRNKAACFRDVSKTRNAILLTMITAEWLTPNAYANDIHQSLTSDVLFE